MSHFTVLVIGDNPEGQLAPYQENNMGDCPQEYMEFNDMTAEVNEEWENGTIQEFYGQSTKVDETIFDKLSATPVGSESPFTVDNEIFRTVKLDEILCFYIQGKKGDTPYFKVTKIVENSENDAEDECREGIVRLERINPPKDISMKKKYKTFEDFMKTYHGYNAPDETTGKYGYWHNPNCKWDWYQLGGRWNGFFIKKQGGKGVAGEPGVFGGKAEVGRIDQGVKGDIDFNAMFDKAADEAATQWDQITQLFDDDIIPQVDQTWKEVIDSMVEFDKEKAIEIYHTQPAVVAYEALKEKYPRATKEKPNGLTKIQENFVNGFHLGGCVMDDFKATRDEFIGRAMSNAITTFAVLKDGEWYERGSMGWWGIVSNEREQKDWNEELYKLIKEVSDDTLFSVYDCHI